MRKTFAIVAILATSLALTMSPASADPGASDVLPAPSSPATSHHGLLSTAHRYMLSRSTIAVQQAYFAKTTTAVIGEIIPALPADAPPDNAILTLAPADRVSTAQALAKLKTVKAKTVKAAKQTAPKLKVAKVKSSAVKAPKATASPTGTPKPNVGQPATVSGIVLPKALRHVTPAMPAIPITLH